jgi:DNA repair exonuclease SbcCD nuclease subunit
MLKAAAPNNVNVIVGTEILDLDGKQFVLVPWINQENTEETFKAIAEVKNKDKTIIAGHFSIAGAKHYAKSAPAEHGLDPAIFKEYQEVWSGHFHHKSKMSNVRYMGSAFHLNWQDYNDARGFHTFDTKTDELVFIENEYCLFVEIGFDADVFKKLTDSEASDMFNSRFIKLIVNGDYDKVALMEAVALINRSKPHDLQIINHTIVKNDSGAEFDGTQDTEIKVAKSTQEYIASYIESRDGYNTQPVKDKMRELLTKSLADMTKGE